MSRATTPRRRRSTRWPRSWSRASPWRTWSLGTCTTWVHNYWLGPSVNVFQQQIESMYQDQKVSWEFMKELQNLNYLEIKTKHIKQSIHRVLTTSCPQITLIHIVLHPVLFTNCLKKLSLKYFFLSETIEVQSVWREHSSSSLLLHLDCEECWQDSLEAVVVGVVRYCVQCAGCLMMNKNYFLSDERLQYLCEVLKITLTIFQYKVSPILTPRLLRIIN